MPELSVHTVIPEPSLSFHPEDDSSQDIHPLRGLLNYGPFSQELLTSPIRVATLVPAGESEKLYSFMRRLKAPAKPTERKAYLPQWPGFETVFRVRMEAASKHCHMEMGQDLEPTLDRSSNPHQLLATRLLRAMQEFETHRSDFDVLFIYLPDRWQPWFTNKLDGDFDLRSYIKAEAAIRGIPTQLVREDRALSYPHVASVMWRIGLALYVKAGGIPWKVATNDPETAFIGLAYAIRSDSSTKREFVTCCSQVFDADGSGLEFIAYNAQEVDIRGGKNPYLTRNEMFRVISRSLDLYRRRHAGRSPRRVMVHKTTEFKKDEVDGCMDALHICDAVDLIQIVQDSGWKGINFTSKGKPTLFPVTRGTVIGLNPYESLLWTHGNVQDIEPNRSYFKGSRSTPSPLRLIRHAGEGPWNDTAKAILALTKMNWNHDELYSILPVTVDYAHTLASIVKRTKLLRQRSYQFRYFM